MILVMKYKGFVGKAEFDDDARLFHGEIVNIRDVITFHCESSEESMREFQTSVDDGLVFVETRGESPEPFPRRPNS